MRKMLLLLFLVCFTAGCATMAGNDFSQYSDDALISYYQDTKSELSFYESQRETNFGSLQGELLNTGSMEKTTMLSQRLLDIRQEIQHRGLNIP